MEVAGLGDERVLGAETKRRRWDWLWRYGTSGGGKRVWMCVARLCHFGSRGWTDDEHIYPER